MILRTRFIRSHATAITFALFGLGADTMAHYFMTMHEPRRAGILLLGRHILAIPLFLLLPHLFGFYGIYLVGPIADLPFAVAYGFMVRELARLREKPAAAAVAPEAVAG